MAVVEPSELPVVAVAAVAAGELVARVALAVVVVEAAVVAVPEAVRVKVAAPASESFY